MRLPEYPHRQPCQNNSVGKPDFIFFHYICIIGTKGNFAVTGKKYEI
jgi:hypothetical protein